MRIWFPDTTVVRNFASIRALPDLERVLDGGGRCTAAMRREFEDASTVRGMEQIGAALAAGVFGDGIEIALEDADAVQAIRVNEVGGDRADPLSSLGEAETIYAFVKLGLMGTRGRILAEPPTWLADFRSRIGRLAA
jgi:hypothetical protein